MSYSAMSDHAVDAASRQLLGNKPKEESAKTSEQRHIDSMSSGSDALAAAITTAQIGRNPRTSTEIVWGYNSSQTPNDYNYSEVVDLIRVDSRICSRCNARAGKCDHGEQWLR